MHDIIDYALCTPFWADNSGVITNFYVNTNNLTHGDHHGDWPCLDSLGVVGPTYTLGGPT